MGLSVLFTSQTKITFKAYFSPSGVSALTVAAGMNIVAIVFGVMFLSLSLSLLLRILNEGLQWLNLCFLWV